MTKKKTKAEETVPAVPDPTSYDDFRVIYEHLVDQYLNLHPGPFGPAMSEAGFVALEVLAEKMQSFVTTLHATRYAPYPVYEVSMHNTGAGIYWYIKPPFVPGSTRRDAYGRERSNFDFTGVPITVENGRYDPCAIRTDNMDQALLWADVFNAAAELRQEGNSALI